MVTPPSYGDDMKSGIKYQCMFAITSWYIYNFSLPPFYCTLCISIAYNRFVFAELVDRPFSHDSPGSSLPQDLCTYCGFSFAYLT